MHTKRRALIVLIGAITFLCSETPQSISASLSVTTETIDPTKLIALSDEPSRGALFEHLIVPTLPIENPGPASAPLKAGFTFPHDAVFDDDAGKKRDNSIFGIDISHYTDLSIDFSTLRSQEINFAYVKATQGTRYVDEKFPIFWKRFHGLPNGLKIYVGPYHFLSAIDDPKAQALNFISYVTQSGGLNASDLPPCLDLEWDVVRPGEPDRWAGFSPDAIIDIVIKWVSIVESETGRAPIIYTNKAWWMQRIHSEPLITRLAKYKLWIADYSGSDRKIEVPAAPNHVKPAMWQFTAKAKLSDFGGELDANMFKGTLDEFLVTMGTNGS